MNQIPISERFAHLCFCGIEGSDSGWLRKKDIGYWVERENQIKECHRKESRFFFFLILSTFEFEFKLDLLER